jgi:hypothetical protein
MTPGEDDNDGQPPLIPPPIVTIARAQDAPARSSGSVSRVC